MSVITSARQVLPSTVVRFAVIGMVNTSIDIVLFWVLHAPLGIVVANFVSTSAGMTFSFLANGRYTFGSTRVTVRQAALFLATNGFTMWLLQPLLIHAAYDVAAVPLMAAKVVALAGSVVVNFLLYRHVVWGQTPCLRENADDLPRHTRDQSRSSAFSPDADADVRARV